MTNESPVVIPDSYNNISETLDTADKILTDAVDNSSTLFHTLAVSLFDGKKVNYTEDKAALHVKNRLELNEIWDGFDILLMKEKLGGLLKLKDGKPDIKIKNIFYLKNYFQEFLSLF